MGSANERATTASRRVASSDGAAETDAAAGRYRIHTVARLTGLGMPLLRQWERRYRLVEPARSDAGYREYSERDVEVFRRARDLLARGLTIGEIAKLGRKTLLSTNDLDELIPRSGDAHAQRGRTMVAEFISAARRGAVQEMDERVFRALHTQTLADAVQNFVRPALLAVGDAWEHGRLGPGIERIASCALRGPLTSLLVSANTGLGALVAVCAPGPGDTHELGALMLAIDFARAGHRALHVGGPLQIDHFVEIANAAAPRALCLSYVHAVRKDRLVAQLRALRAALPRRVQLLVGGRALRGLEHDAEDTGAIVPTDSPDAVARVALSLTSR